MDDRLKAQLAVKQQVGDWPPGGGAPQPRRNAAGAPAGAGLGALTKPQGAAATHPINDQ